MTAENNQNPGVYSGSIKDRSFIDAQIDVLASLMTFQQATDKYDFKARTAAYLAVAWLRMDGPDLVTAWESQLLLTA